MKTIANKKYFNTYFSLGVMVLLIIAFALIEGRFLNAANVSNILSDTAPLMIMAAGMTPILLLGSIDLSVGALCSAANVSVLTIMLRFYDMGSSAYQSMLFAFIITLGFGVLAGLVLGFIHVKTKIPSFIASLAFMSIWSSAALLISPASISLPWAMWGTIDWFRISFGPLGLPLFVALVIIGIYYIVLTRTPFGRGVYAIGANERAARLAGIPVDRIKVAVFAINGFTTALGAIFLMAHGRSAAPTAGTEFTLMVISSVVIGGTSLIGGSGSIINTVFGVFIIAIIRNGMNMVGVNVFWQSIVFGSIILVAIALSTNRSSSRAFLVK